MLQYGVSAAGNWLLRAARCGGTRRRDSWLLAEDVDDDSVRALKYLLLTWADILVPPPSLQVQPDHDYLSSGRALSSSTLASETGFALLSEPQVYAGVAPPLR